MARSHVTHDDSGIHVPYEWDGWVSAGKTRNYLSDDPLLDWLNLFGEDNGFKKDNNYPDYDENLDFLPLLFRKGREFEDTVVEYLKQQHGAENFVLLGDDYRHSWNPEKAKETFDLLKQGVPIILQAVLWNPQNRTYGMPDLLVRSDWLNQITEEGSISASEEHRPAPALGGDYHYRVVDVKFSTLRFNADKQYLLDGHGSHKAYKAQLAIYNRALGRLQEYEPPQAYLLGRNWTHTQRGKEHRGKHALERLASVDFSNRDEKFYDLAEESIEWIRRVRKEGGGWQVFPEPSVPELWPNAKGGQCYPWDHAKAEIVDQYKDITKLWQVGIKERKLAHEQSIYTWDDATLTPGVMGITGEKKALTLKEIIKVNRESNTDFVLPPIINNDQGEWQQKSALEFFVDFETVNTIDDDFSTFPRPGGEELIFMVGCGYESPDRNWEFKVITANELSVSEETRIIKEWFQYMREVTDRILGEGSDLPKIFHWSYAELNFMKSAQRNREEAAGGATLPEWPELPWFDFLKVMRAVPVVVKGAFGFGLKAIAKNLYKHGLIETSWEDGPVDGLGAMVGAWYCNRQVAETGQSMRDMDYMQEIENYNEVDCKVMWELVNYLRENHT